MTETEKSAFAAAIIADPESLERHIRDEGGSMAEFAADWRAKRTRKALAVEITPEIVETILDAPLAEDCRWDRPNATVRDYLTELLVEVWRGNAGPEDGMVGSSDWEFDLYDVLLRLQLVPAWEDGWGPGRRADGSSHPEDKARANDLIEAAIRALGGAGR